ncbi:unnamed protein product [Cylicocyclus nassatus]|uniref:C6 domain-containing protein n=1 Tax=Cylicocyclus nassatus TaxID=53992 RepID=A0AA36H436_CYLNA|nr:unnamed protein product [Cylicocyclus nassatus]
MNVLHFTLFFATVGVMSAATTKKPVPACAKCLPRTAVLMAASGPGTVKPTNKVVANTAAGCKRINVICTAPAGATKASMEFNRRYGGPYEGKVVTATLTCDAQQKWRYSKDGAIIIVNSVNCMYV